MSLLDSAYRHIEARYPLESMDVTLHALFKMLLGKYWVVVLPLRLIFAKLLNLFKPQDTGIQDAFRHLTNDAERTEKIVDERLNAFNLGKGIGVNRK